MLSYCLKCREKTVGKNPDIIKTKNEGPFFYQTVPCVLVKNKD